MRYDKNDMTKKFNVHWKDECQLNVAYHTENKKYKMKTLIPCNGYDMRLRIINYRDKIDKKSSYNFEKRSANNLFARQKAAVYAK